MRAYSAGLKALSTMTPPLWAEDDGEPEVMHVVEPLTIVWMVDTPPERESGVFESHAANNMSVPWAMSI